MQPTDTHSPQGPATGFPRGRGFNLLEMFKAGSEAEWQEHDFQWIADWGFDFVRLPLAYPLWIEGGSEGADPFTLSEPGLARVDRAVDLALKHGLHACLNFHRAPGYCVNPDRTEPFWLWRDAEALNAFCFHWQTFAQRYRGIPSSRLSFNLINEPPGIGDQGHQITKEQHRRVIHSASTAVRAVDPERLIIADGVEWGNAPSPELADLGLGQSCRAYLPFELSHYKAPWFLHSDTWPVPAWPGPPSESGPGTRAALQQHYRTWGRLADLGVWVHCGEGGSYNRTPHAVVLAWLRDVLEILHSYGIGLALWNFRGPFGIFDSNRPDVEYESFHGHHLDRKLLRLLQQFE